MKERTGICDQCNGEFEAIGTTKPNRFCSIGCRKEYFKDNMGPRAWPIGTVSQDPDGYRRVKVSRGKWKSEHVLVVEKALGRTLTRAEVVHHRNGNPSDNRIENLQVVSRSQHMKIHHEAERIGLRVMAGELEVVEIEKSEV